jgi:nicotinamidase-related amidase
MVPNVARLAAAARRAGAAVVHTTALRRLDGRAASTNARLFIATQRTGRAVAPGSAEAEIVPEIPVAESDLVVPRLHGVSPMHATELDPILRNLGVRTVVAVGVSVNIALTNLVFDAVNAGYQVVVPRDAVAGLPAEYVDAVFAHTLGLLATVTTTAEVVAVWER